MSTETKHHPQAYYASHDQLYSWYEKLLEGAIKAVATGSINPVYESLAFLNPGNWVEVAVQHKRHYTVKPGDTMSMIALMYGKSTAEDLQELVRLNHRVFINAPYHLLAGYKLLIPSDWPERPLSGVHLNKSNFDE